MANLIPYTKSPIIKPQKSAIIKADKFLNTKSTKVNENSVKPKQSENSSEDIILQIEKKVIKIDKLLKDSFALKKKQQKKVRIKGEQKEFEDREKELEKKKPKKQKGVNLPTPPKMGFLDWIKNFITQTVLGFIAVRLIDFLPQLLKILPVIIKVTDFITDIGGKLLDGLVTFIDWGYKAYDATRGFIKNIFGENGVKQFDQLSGVLNKFLNLAIIAGLVAAGSGGLGKKPGAGAKPGSGAKPGAGAKPGQGGRPKVTTSGGGGSGRPNIRNPLRQRPGVTTSGGGTGGLDIRNPLRAKPKVTLGGGGNKALLSSVRPFLKRIPLPVVGALIDFGLSIALGENVGRAAFRAIGAGLLGAVGSAVGSVVPIAGNIIGGIIGGTAGDIAGGALYDMFFTGKKPNQKQGKTNKLAGGGSPIPSTRRGKSVSSAPTRTLKKKKKSTRSLSFIPSKIKPGKSVGGEDKVQSVFPNPNKPVSAWWDPLGVFSGKTQEEPQQKKSTEKISNPEEFLLESNDVLGKSNSFGPFFTLALKSVLGDKPNKLDYLKVGQGLNSWMQGVFKTGPLGFAGGGEVDAKQFFGGEDYTQVIAKSVEDSVSKEIDTTIRNLKDELSLRKPVGKDEMTQENIRKGTGGGGGDGGGGGGYDDSPHGTPGPAVQATSGFNPGKGDRSRKIFLHWTVGSHNQNFSNYHTTFLGNGKAVRNRGYGVDGTEHTGGANTNSVGLAIAAMGGKGVNENKFGSFPPTSTQVSAMALEAARLAVAWGWDESTIEKNVMTHGEWERYATKSGILPGAPQKWDLDKLRQSDPTNSGGDKLRKMIKSYFKKLKAGATVDSSGKVISKTTGSPLAQMSLDTAMEMTEPGSKSGARISGGTADFWALAAISALEGINAQGEADVAQSIYNRAAAGVFPGGKSIHGIITKDAVQYSPVKESNPALWRAIKDKESAIKAVASHRNGGANASKKLESAAKNIKNPALQAEAAKFVGGRTDFNSLGVYGSDPPGAISVVKRNGHRFGFWVGPGSKNYGRSNPKAAGVPSLGATVAAGTTPGTGIQGKTSEAADRLLKEFPQIKTKSNVQQIYASGLGFWLKKNFNVAADDGMKPAGRGDYADPPGAPYGGMESPDHGGVVGSHRGRGHYLGKALDLGANGGRLGTDQDKLFPYVQKFLNTYGLNNSKTIPQVLHATDEAYSPVGPRGGPDGGHNDHLHVEFAKGGVTPGTPTPAMVGDGKGSNKGPEYVMDANTYQTIQEVAPGLFDILNYGVKDKASLIKYLPNIISSLSQYADYENPNQEPQIIYIEVPVEVPVPIGSGGGGNIFIGGGVNKNNGMEATLTQVG